MPPAETDVERKRLGLAFAKGAIDEATLDEEIAKLDASVIELDALIERQEQRAAQREALTHTLDDLLSMPIRPVAEVGLDPEDINWVDSARLLPERAEAALDEAEELPESH